MLQIVLARVKKDKLDVLRAWMRELASRRAEVEETLRREGVRHETVHLLETSDGPILSYVMELEDVTKAEQTFAASTLPIDVEHRRVMSEVLDGRAPSELLLDVRV